jgi:histidinol-phosphate aminotransferase
MKECSMSTRRAFFAQFGAAAAAARLLPEMAYAQRAADLKLGELPADTVWLNSNENPLGIPEPALAAMRDVLPTANRYHFSEFRQINAAIAQSEELSPDQVVLGAGSSEVLHTVIDVFTSATRPIITVAPAYEAPIEQTMTFGRPVVLTLLRDDYTPDVHKLAEEADKAHGGLIYLPNPNNPTSAVTRAKELDWLVNNLPADTMLLMDEAYIHYVEAADVASAMPYVRQGKNVIVARTFSKIYGMAGLRAGFAAARPDIIERIAPLRICVISIVTARGVLAALGERDTILPPRKASLARTRRELCDWLRENKLGFIEPHANFIMIDCGRDASEFVDTMPRLGVAPGRPFPPLTNMLRVTIGTDREMARFREVFWKVYKA